MALLSYMDVVARLERMKASSGITEAEKQKIKQTIDWILSVNER
ncbi:MULTISPECIES: hypothetical protein [unclassified Bacillus cereus group]|nr:MULTISPECIES: hypothetical protein [unclassified Bacillus cereus group]MDA1642425.1 hypothetical protein [Bacillus cereus group sp. TH177-1LC]MDA1802936.1 hypothetical protein [Bacillus cereus group sp. BY6-1LC]